MASSPLRTKSFCHARSASLPSGLNLVIPHVNEHLRLSGLEIMYDHLDDLVLLPHTQQSFAQQRREKRVEVMLEKYIRILDACATSKDVSSQTKQDLQGLLSILRRRWEEDDFSGHLNSRKKVIQKSQKKDLKSIKTRHAIRGHGKSQELLDSLNEVEAATIGVLQSFLSYISGTEADSRLSAFSLASKLVHRKSVAFQTPKAETQDLQASPSFQTRFQPITLLSELEQARPKV